MLKWLADIIDRYVLYLIDYSGVNTFHFPAVFIIWVLNSTPLDLWLMIHNGGYKSKLTRVLAEKQKNPLFKIK